MSEPVPNRRWFRFSLRTLFVVVTVLCVWLGYQLNWIRQRHAILKRDWIFSVLVTTNPPDLPPGTLWLFNERGIDTIAITSNDPADRSLIENLFPEAEIEFEADSHRGIKSR